MLGERYKTRTFLCFGNFTALCLVGLPLLGEIPTAPVGQTVELSEIHLGSFCVTDLPSGSVKMGKGKEEEYGIWVHRDIQIDKAPMKGASPPRVYFFDSPAPENDGFVPCASQPGRNTVLEGTLRPGSKITGLIFKPNGNRSARFQVDPWNLDLTLGDVRSSVKTVFGAPVDFENRLLWIKNPSRMLVVPDRGTYEAVLAVQATDLNFPGAQLRLSDEGSAVLTTNLSNIYLDDRLTFELDVTQGDLVLTDGILRAGVSQGADLTWTAGGLQLLASDFETQAITVTAKERRLTIELEDLTVTAVRLEHGAPLRATLVPSEPFTAAALRAEGLQSPEQLALQGYEWQVLSVKSDSVTILDRGDAEQVRGSGWLRLASLDDQSINGRLELQHPSIALAAQLGLIKDPPSLNLGFAGAKDHVVLEGEVATDHLDLGALRVEDQGVHPLKFSSTDAGLPVVQLEIGLDLEPEAGKVTLSDPTDPSRPITLEARLDHFQTRGIVYLGFGEDLPRLELSAGGIQASFAATTTTRSAIFGSPVQMVGVSAGLQISQPVVVTPVGLRGSLEINTEGVVIAEGQVDLSDESGMPFTLEGALNTTADATLGLDLASGGYRLLEAHFDLKGLEAKSGGRVNVGLGGLQLETPSLSIGRLQLDVVGGVGEVVAESFSFDARSVRYAGPPVVELELGAPLTIPSMRAALGEDQRAALRVTHVALFDLDLDAPSARFISPDGFSLFGQGARLFAPMVATDALDGTVSITVGSLKVEAQDGKAEGSAAFRGFELAVDKTPDRLLGQGQLLLENISIKARDRLAVGKCSRNRQWKIRSQMSIDEVKLKLSLDDQHLTGDATINDVIAEIRNDGYSRCEWDERVVLWPKQEAIFDVPCGVKVRGFKTTVKMCRNRVTLVPEARAKIHWVAELHELDVKAGLSEVKVALRGDRGVEVCPKGIELYPPLIVANYHPNIKESDVPVVGNLLRDLIRGAATLFEGALATLIGSQIALGNYLDQLLFPPQCYGG